MQAAVVSRGKWVVACLIPVVLVLLFLPFALTVQWVGGTDLEIEFVVRDAESGQPIENALIHIQAEQGGFCKDRDEDDFGLVTDGLGRVKKLCEDCMCFGTRGLGKDTFAVHMPQWWFRVSAAGYGASEWNYLNDFPYRRNVQRGEGLAHLAVTVRLHKVGM